MLCWKHRDQVQDQAVYKVWFLDKGDAILIKELPVPV